jgi:hypothetical protein
MARYAGMLAGSTRCDADRGQRRVECRDLTPIHATALDPMRPALLAGLALLAAYWAWIFVFFACVRPRIMRALARSLGVKVEESTSVLDAGIYGVKGDRPPLRALGAVHAVDLAVLLAGTVGVAALVFVPAFIVADRGMLLSLETIFTGRGAVLRVFDDVDMTSNDSRATLWLDVQNTGHDPLRDCVGGVDGYSARNGYLHGNTERFDLAAGERRPIRLDLEATRPHPGMDSFRLKLECMNERLAVADAVLKVR